MPRNHAIKHLNKNSNSLDCFFSPDTVAVIGASRHPNKIGHVVFRNFIESGYGGSLYPVNPNADEILGRKCYKSISDIKERVDLAIITIPAEAVLGALEQCGRKGVRAAVIITSGFKEIGNTGLEEKLLKIIRKYRMRVIGPNCLGVYEPSSGVDTFFLPRYKLGRPGPGSISFITQSGALGSVAMDWMEMKGYRISKFISYGNASDVDEAELIEYLGQDRKTSVICAYFEGLKDGRKFFQAAKKVSWKKPIIALKAGATEAGVQAASSHTGSLAGSAEIHEAAFRQAGIIAANDLEQIFDFARVLSTQPKPKGNRVQIITDGGGFGVMTADWLVKNNLVPARMSRKNIEKIRKVCPPYAVLKNPMDLTGDADSERYKTAIEAALGDTNIDMVALIVLLQIPTLTPDVIDTITGFAVQKKKPIIVISAGGRYTETLKKTLEDSGIPTFSYPHQACEAMRVLYEYSKKQ